MKNRFVKRPPADVKSVEFLIDKGFSQHIAEALSARGINEDTFDDFSGQLTFHSPFEMSNMREAVDTINEVIDCGGSVLIYGDYDADGLTAASILSLYFSDNGVDNDVIIPTRDEGYGLHAENVFRAFENNFYDLLITVDCGISNAAEVQKIVNELGVEVIVTDHHELPEVLPDCICVNPKLGYPFPYLAGAGVAWKLVEALAGREVAAKYSDLACIGTIGDIMPMQDENRSIVKLGLSNRGHKSIQKLAELSNCSTELNVNDISMRIVPKINAAGRVGLPQVALSVLLCRDKADSVQINKLLELNDQRKRILDEITIQSDEMCNAKTIARERMVFLYSDTWQHGLLGIVASRYKEKYKLPAIVMTLDGDEYVGSARGIETLDLFDLFTQCKQHLLRYGGHKASVGFSVAKDCLNDFRQAMASALGALDATLFEKVFYYDIDLGNDCDVTEVMDITQQLQPLLPQDKIICRVTDSVKFANAFGKDDAHLSVTLSRGLEVKGFFKYGVYAPFIRNGANVDLLCSLEVDNYSKKICGIIEDFTLCNSVCFDEFYRLNLLKNFVTDDIRFDDVHDINKVLAMESVIVAFDDYETYLAYCDKYDLTDFYVDVFFDNSVANKTVVVSPLGNYCFDRYSNVVAFSRKGIVRKLPHGTKYFEVTPANSDLYDLELARDVCLKVYQALKRKDKFDSIKGVYDKYLANSLSYAQYVVALRVFEELKLIAIVDNYSVKFDTSVKQDLSNSSIFRTFQKSCGEQ
ncbi:MAG: DHH family phosphoesterase [Clostridiales bacterium]|nr:DHH family phosphoesterase [Clostridiales bacterium]